VSKALPDIAFDSDGSGRQMYHFAGYQGANRTAQWVFRHHPNPGLCDCKGRCTAAGLTGETCTIVPRSLSNGEASKGKGKARAKARGKGKGKGRARA
jgi:hypothetical protein